MSFLISDVENSLASGVLSFFMLYTLDIQERHASGHVFRLGLVWGFDSLVSRAKVIENQDSSKVIAWDTCGRVILFGTIPTTIPDTTPVIIPPTTQTDTIVIPTETPIQSDPSEDPPSDHIPPLSATSPFLSSDDDTTDSDSPDTPPSPTHAYSQCRSVTRCKILNRRLHMMTVRKRVGPLPTHCLAVRHSSDHSSSYSSSEASLDFHSDASFDSSSRHSLSDHSSLDIPSTSAGPSRKRQIDECFAYTDALRDKGIDARVVELSQSIVYRSLRESRGSRDIANLLGLSDILLLWMRGLLELEKDNKRLSGT
ncbi:hypothetical protein Tco_0718345 [Tanacetum coccineum]